MTKETPGVGVQQPGFGFWLYPRHPMTLGKSRDLPEPQFLHCSGDPLAPTLAPHTGGRDDYSAHLVKWKPSRLSLFSPDLLGAAVLFWDAGGAGCGSERGWVPGVEKARAFLDLRRRFQVLGRCEGLRGDGQKLSQRREWQRQRGRERPRRGARRSGRARRRECAGLGRSGGVGCGIMPPAPPGAPAPVFPSAIHSPSPPLL